MAIHGQYLASVEPAQDTDVMMLMHMTNACLEMYIGYEIVYGSKTLM